KDGYAVVSLHWRADGSIEERPFLTGFLQGEQVIGRPVDGAEGPDGALYVSDDYGAVIYRAGREPSSRGGAAPPASARGGEAADLLAGYDGAELEAARERGSRLYELHACARCHESERADPGVVVVPIEARRLRGKYDVASLADYLLAPTPPMPAFEIDEAGRRALAVWLLTRASD